MPKQRRNLYDIWVIAAQKRRMMSLGVRVLEDNPYGEWEELHHKWKIRQVRNKARQIVEYGMQKSENKSGVVWPEQFERYHYVSTRA